VYQWRSHGPPAKPVQGLEITKIMGFKCSSDRRSCQATQDRADPLTGSSSTQSCKTQRTDPCPKITGREIVVESLHHILNGLAGWLDSGGLWPVGSGEWVVGTWHEPGISQSHFDNQSIHIETQCERILHGYPGSDRPDVRLTWITDLNEHGVGGVLWECGSSLDGFCKY